MGLGSGSGWWDCVTRLTALRSLCSGPGGGFVGCHVRTVPKKRASAVAVEKGLQKNHVGGAASKTCAGNGECAAAPHIPGVPSLPPPCIPSFQMDIFLAKEERDRLRREKQVLEKKLGELKQRSCWEDPVMVTVCGCPGELARGASLAGGLQVNAAGRCVTTGTAPAGPKATTPGTARP